MPKQKKAAAKPELKVSPELKLSPKLKVKPKKLDQTLKNGKKTVHAKVDAFAKTDAKVDASAKTDAKASRAKPVVLKLPRPLKKAARACAKDQGLKLRAWIVELIQTQLSKVPASPAEKSLQTL